MLSEVNDSLVQINIELLKKANTTNVKEWLAQKATESDVAAALIDQKAGWIAAAVSEVQKCIDTTLSAAGEQQVADICRRTGALEQFLMDRVDAQTGEAESRMRQFLEDACSTLHRNVTHSQHVLTLLEVQHRARDCNRPILTRALAPATAHCAQLQRRGQAVIA
ncbi:hypothetical protein CYMTET_34913 [Cymbomonas tetramitiformis]|uniref:Uncharacterized protein n=1 Tax=Cymbomonas tetramitiformis TaxID=36881 RepID=A0AAE0FAB9_9CHLO|nr:hypothetical protein CYMTET_34913 [Cymbomonas tetramitiformis]